MKIIEKETKLKEGKEEIWFNVYKDGYYQHGFLNEGEARGLAKSVLKGYPKKEIIFEEEISDQK